jgi:hypothetical protein
VSLFVVDAGVVIKWFVPEIHSDATRRLLSEPHEYFSPDLLSPEVGNVIWKKVRRGELTAEQGERLPDSHPRRRSHRDQPRFAEVRPLPFPTQSQVLTEKADQLRIVRGMLDRSRSREAAPRSASAQNVYGSAFSDGGRPVGLQLHPSSDGLSFLLEARCNGRPARCHAACRA